LIGAFSLFCLRNSEARPRDEMMELYGVFVDAVEQVEANYVRKVDRKELIESALRGMLMNLDPHSAYFTDADWKRFKKQVDGTFTGIGISVEVDEDTGRLKVLAPLPGSPAYAAGVLPGDVIVEVDGHPTEGMTRDKAVEAMQGRPGTQIKMSVIHEGAAKPEAMTLTRAVIEVPSILGDDRKPDNSWDFMLDKDKKIGYVRLTNFTPATTEELKNALEDLKTAGMKGLILDLRDDPGGLLSTAVEVADVFLEDGVIVSTKGRNQREKAYEATREGTFELPGAGAKFPMAILINQGSASASEIVAASLQDHGRAVVVGHRSFGKGSVQHTVPLDNGDSILKLTVATYWRPSGKNIHRFKDAKDSDEWGVSPNPGMEVNLSDREYFELIENRRDRDALHRVGETKPRAPAEGDKPKAREDDPHKERAARPQFADRQLAKALDVVRAKLAEPPAGATARQ
jgi:carboxyl-terminal processing protease